MAAGNVSSDWGDWTDANQPDMSALAERQRYEGYVSALWREVKRALVATIGNVNTRLPDVQRVEAGDSPSGGLSLTRWSDYPVAFLDVSVDVDSGMIGCLYTFAARDGDPYREVHKVWLMRGAEAGLIVTDEQGRAVASSDELAQQIAEPYLAGL